MNRSSGVLMHISSLPSPYGIGTFGEEAYHFVDFLARTKQSYWQILPLTTTSYGDSPYQSFSAFAGNTNFIDFDRLLAEGWLEPDDLKDWQEDEPSQVNYGHLFVARRHVLDQAVERFVAAGGMEEAKFQAFVAEHADWLVTYGQFMTVKEAFDLKAFNEWPETYRHYDKEIVERYCKAHEKVWRYYLVTQYWFFEQWQALKAYANAHGVKIIGDMPIYVARDSVEMWTEPKLFKLDENGDPLVVAGTPPDAFSDDGQYWGNPIYDWQYMKSTHYEWWIKRMKASLALYDVVRIDHFRGFESYWEVPFGAPSSACGHWAKGPDSAFFDEVESRLGRLPIIAEDLGFMTPEVEAMRAHVGYPGMKILQFAFDGEHDSPDMPHNYQANVVAYVGTHDNETARGHYEDTASQEEREQVDHYLHREAGESPNHAYHRGLAASVSQLVIYTMQDLLELGNEARMNEPSTIGCNWRWRMLKGATTKALEEDLLDLTLTYYRA